MIKRLLAVALFLSVTRSASAQWLYDFHGHWFIDDVNVELIFQLNNATPITVGGNYAPGSCIFYPVPPINGTTYTCAPTQFFDPTGFGTGYDLISAQYQSTGPGGSGGGGAYFFFAPTAFTTPGHYEETHDNLGIYGNAGTATLDVRNLTQQPPGAVAPEPATMALLATGLMGIGAARKRSRRK